MPNPSTIAMYEDNSLVTMTTEIKDGVEHTVTSRRTFPALLVEIEDLKKQLAEQQTKYAQLDQDFNEYIRQRNGEYIRWADQIGTFKVRNSELLGATAQMAKEMTEAIESRDRVLRENCDLTIKVQALQKIARAAKEVEDAGTAYGDAEYKQLFEDGPNILDSVLERNANAQCEVQKLLEEHKGLY